MTITRDTGGITLVLHFTDPVISPVTGDSDATTALVDFDVDQDSTTGLEALVVIYRPSTGSTGMGADYTLPAQRDHAVAAGKELGRLFDDQDAELSKEPLRLRAAEWG